MLPERILKTEYQKAIFTWINVGVFVLLLTSIAGKSLPWTTLEQNFEIILFTVDSVETTAPGEFVGNLGIAEGERCQDDGSGDLACGSSEKLDVFGCEEAAESTLALMTFAMMLQILNISVMSYSNLIGMNVKVLRIFLFTTMVGVAGCMLIAMLVWYRDCHTTFNKEKINSLVTITVELTAITPSKKLGSGFMIAVSALATKLMTIPFFWKATSQPYQKL